MEDSVFSSLLNMMDPRDLRGIASAIGEPGESVSRGMRSSVAAVLGNIASKAGDPGVLRKTLDLLPSGSSEIMWSNVVEAASDPQSPMIGMGKRILSGLFGSTETTVKDAISQGSGIRSNVASTMLAVVAPFVLSFLGRKVRDDGLSMSALGSILRRDAASIRSALPAGLTDVIWPRSAAAGMASPVVAQEVHVDRPSRSWYAPVALAGLALVGFWLLHQARRPTSTQMNPTPTGTASRAAPEETVRHRTAPDTAKPQDTGKPQKALENADLNYVTGSARLTRASQERLNHLAEQLAASPDAHVKVAGYTDDVGDADRNLRLSQKRADNVRAALVRKGVPPDRLTAKGYGEDNPISNNSTREGRAQNRRVSISTE